MVIFGHLQAKLRDHDSVQITYLLTFCDIYSMYIWRSDEIEGKIAQHSWLFEEDRHNIGKWSAYQFIKKLISCVIFQSTLDLGPKLSTLLRQFSMQFPLSFADLSVACLAYWAAVRIWLNIIYSIIIIEAVFCNLQTRTNYLSICVLLFPGIR